MSKRILIVDDDRTLVALLKEGLETTGYEVAVAFDGLQGILQAHQFRPELIVLDFYMPGGGGSTVYERLRAAPDTKDTPIVFSTSVPLESLKGHVKPSAHTYFLKKPIGLQQVLAVMSSVLGVPMPSEAVINGHVAPRPQAAPPPSAPLPAPEPRPVLPASPATVPRRPKHHEYEVRVTYADTDKMGIIYYANYFKYFEQGRTELMRSLGVRYRELEVTRKLFLPAVEARCRYLGPSRYDDVLIVRTWLAELGKASVVFQNEIYDKERPGKKLAEGYSRHAVVNDLWRSMRVPDDLRLLLQPYVA